MTTSRMRRWSPALPGAMAAGGLRCHLADLAARRRPEADVPALDEEVVETGSGLRLYRRPILQSPGGREVILPRVRDTQEARGFRQTASELFDFADDFAIHIDEVLDLPAA